MPGYSHSDYIDNCAGIVLEYLFHRPIHIFYKDTFMMYTKRSQMHTLLTYDTEFFETAVLKTNSMKDT